MKNFNKLIGTAVHLSTLLIHENRLEINFSLSKFEVSIAILLLFFADSVKEIHTYIQVISYGPFNFLKQFSTTTILLWVTNVQTKETPLTYYTYIVSPHIFNTEIWMELLVVFFSIMFLNDKNMYVNRLFKSIIHSFLDPFSFNHRFSTSFSTMYRKRLNQILPWFFSNH